MPTAPLGRRRQNSIEVTINAADQLGPDVSLESKRLGSWKRLGKD